MNNDEFFTIDVPADIHVPAASRYFARRISRLPRDSSQPSPLLQRVRAAIRGEDRHEPPVKTVMAPKWCNGFHLGDGLAWDDHVLVWTGSNIIRRRWDLTELGQRIHYACMAVLPTPGKAWPMDHRVKSTSDVAVEEYPSTSSSSSEDTFGPYARLQQNRKKTVELASHMAATFVFMRSFGKCFLHDGSEFTFSLPFVVRKAWPLYPCGVLIQRLLEKDEIEEAAVMGNVSLPSLFTLTDPFVEPRPVGLREPSATATVPTEEEIQSLLEKPLPFIPADEDVIWVSDKHPECIDLFATVNAAQNRISLWQYVAARSKGIATALGPNRARSLSARRTSMSAHNFPPDMNVPAANQDLMDRADRLAPLAGDMLEPTQPSEFTDISPFASIPGMATNPGVPGSPLPWSTSQASHGRRTSSSKHDLTRTMDRMAIGQRSETRSAHPVGDVKQERLNPELWAKNIHSFPISPEDASNWRGIEIHYFQNYTAPTTENVAVFLPSTHSVLFLAVNRRPGGIEVSRVGSQTCLSVSSIVATRRDMVDLLLLIPDGRMVIMGPYAQPLLFVPNYPVVRYTASPSDAMAVDPPPPEGLLRRRPLFFKDAVGSSVILVFADHTMSQLTFTLRPQDDLTYRVLNALGINPVMKRDSYLAIHRQFLLNWSRQSWSTAPGIEFDCLRTALFSCLRVEPIPVKPSHPWLKLTSSRTHTRLQDDPALRSLKLPQFRQPQLSSRPLAPGLEDFNIPGILHNLHLLAGELSLSTLDYYMLHDLVPLLCKLACSTSIEYVHHWARFYPAILDELASLRLDGEYKPSSDLGILRRMPDILSHSFIVLSHADPTKSPSLAHWPLSGIQEPRFFSTRDPFARLREITAYMRTLAGDGTTPAVIREHAAVAQMHSLIRDAEWLNTLSVGVSTPLREAVRGSFLNPSPNWPPVLHRLVGRNDTADSVLQILDSRHHPQFKKPNMGPQRSRKTYDQMFQEVQPSLERGPRNTSGVEFADQEYINLRFGEDRRIQEVARMLSSSAIPIIKMPERPELNEHDLVKEQQNQAVRTVERTLSLPVGRGMLTFGSTDVFYNELLSVPKIELSVKIQPYNTVITPDATRFEPDSLQWAEFHNGVATALRISQTAGLQESGLMTFSKPTVLDPSKAGFLFGLGLTGHLKNMLTWHMFNYLAPKHDFTSIGVLLGLAAANVGSGDVHITKLLAVHTPALLPTPNVDLNVTLMMQSAGLVGIGLLYMGTKNRRRAEVALHQISRSDLSPPDISNEYREAYTTAAALCFGMIMLGQGSSTTSQADMALVSRLRVLIHGERSANPQHPHFKPSFDINLTSPAASIALGLMHLKTGRRDIADMLTIPDTALGLNSIQPSFLLMRAIARGLIMWNNIAPTREWFLSQMPPVIGLAGAASGQLRPLDEAYELAHFHLLSGSCFLLGLKFAGSADPDVIKIVLTYWDHYEKMSRLMNPAYEHRIKRSAVRDGLNVLTLSMSMIMAGTGDLGCLQRLRFAHGNVNTRYGTHLVNHMGIGLMFLGGGRFSLGTSNAAIAAMITAFYPRFPLNSADSKSHLPALRHLWVLAAEPRCLITRDAETREVLQLPVKVHVRKGDGVEELQLITPSLLPPLEKILLVKIDNPRYLPTIMNIQDRPNALQNLLRSRPILVQRRTAFLSYNEDPRGTRGVFVRTLMSTGDAASLTFPGLNQELKLHPASDVAHFVTSASTRPLFVGFADRFCREGYTEEEKIFHKFCHAVLLDCLIQDKHSMVMPYLAMFQARTMPHTSRDFYLKLHDLRFMHEFYSKVYVRKLSGRFDVLNSGISRSRPPLMQEQTVRAALQDVDDRLNQIRQTPRFQKALVAYLEGKSLGWTPDTEESVLNGTSTASRPEWWYEGVERDLAWYMLRESVPNVPIMREIALMVSSAKQDWSSLPVTSDEQTFARETHRHSIHAVAQQLGPTAGGGWTIRSFDEIFKLWTSSSSE